MVVEVEPPRTSSVTEEMRVLDHLARHLPDHAVAAIEAFDPERRAVWVGGPFVTTDEPILGRPVVSGRPTAFVALEDKMLADDLWDAAGVARAPYDVLPVERVGPRGRDPRAGRAAGRGVVRRHQGGLQRRWRLRPLGPRRGRPGPGAGLLPAPLRPRARDAVPRRGAVLDPRAGAARRHRRVPAGGDLDPARRGRTHLHLRRPVDLLGRAARRPRGDARLGAPRRRAPARGPRLPRAHSASTAC